MRGQKLARRSDHSREELHRLALDAAREIVREDGFEALKARRVAERIGYTVGTLYQVFENLDDLIEQMNVETLQALHDQCQDVNYDRGPAESLMSLAGQFVTYFRSNSHLWSSVVFHKLPPNYVRRDTYQKTVLELMSLIERAIDPYFSPGQETKRIHEARVLWASVYGICALDVASRLSSEDSLEAMVKSLIGIYVAAK